MKRLLAGLLLLLLTLVAAAAGGAIYAERRGLALLDQRGVRWEHLSRDGLRRRFSGLTWRGLRAESVQLDLRTPRTLQVSGVDVDLAALRDPLSGGGGGAEDPGERWVDGVVLSVSALRLRWGDEVLADGLSGEVRPGRAALDGEGVSLRAPGPSGERAWLHLDRDLDLEHISGPLSIELGLGERWSVAARSEALRLDHPTLALRPFVVDDWSLNLGGSPEDLTGTLSVDGVAVTLSARCDDLPPTSCQVSAELPDTPAAAALHPFARVVPELRKATVTGTLGGSFTYSWPDGAWTAEPRMVKLAVDGAAPVVESLRGGRFTYLIRDAEGRQTTRVTGEGSRNWTPLMAITPRLGQAIQAAEDAAFMSHRGYDPRAIAEALAEASEAGELGRGGSTLSQQLAKNLFLDGSERTIARKLRELLIAVELDRVLGKRRVLELYMNVVEWGPDIHGIAEAADYYFLKRPANLNPAEAAFLAVLLPSPRTYHDLWYMRGRASEVRVGWVLNNMANAGVLSREEAAKWAASTIRFVPPPAAHQK